MPSTPLTSVVRHINQLAAGCNDGESTDAQLLERYRTRYDEAAFSAIVRRHGRMVLGVCRGVLRQEQDAEDAFQATFLVLARNAASIRKGTALPSWLYGVAHRIAGNVRRAASQRAAHERKVREVARTQTDLSPTWRELQEVLADEVSRLPEKYRAPFVLCCLEGKSKAEAAAQLGWKEGTVSGRLARARERMRQRLTRRGLTLTTVLCASALSTGDALAVRPSLIKSTIKAALGAAAGRGTVAGSSTVAALAEGVSKAMFASKVKVVVLLVLTIGLLTVSAGLMCREVGAKATSDAEQTAAAADGAEKPAKKNPPVDVAAKVEVSGRVLGPDGQPFAGAKMFLWTNAVKKKDDLVVAATTGKDGRFRFTVGKAELERQAKIVATAKDHGPDWAEVKPAQKEEVTLRLAKDDVPVSGRILDLEGRPVAGAIVEVSGIDQGQNGDLKPFFDNVARNRYVYLNYIKATALEGTTSVTTGKDGRFRLSGFGKERVVYLRIKGPNIENGAIHVVTRPGPVPIAPNSFLGGFPATFDYTTRPSKPIVGTIRDKATAKPLSGITVSFPRYNRSLTTTDAQGRYRLEGVGKNKDYDVTAEGMPYFNSTKLGIPDTAGLEPITVDFELERGIPVKGRLTDKATGKPVQGFVTYIHLADNPHVKNYTELDKLHICATQWGRTAADGSFSQLAIPGPGLLCAAADENAQFVAGEVKPGYKTNYILEGYYHAVVPIDVPENAAKTMICDITLSPGRILTGSVVDPDGGPVAGAFPAGLLSIGRPLCAEDQKLATAAFTVGSLDPRKSRILVFIHPEKKLAKVQKFQGDEQSPLTVQLEPLATLTGRFLDANGKPRSGLTVAAMMSVQPEVYKELPIELLHDYPRWSKLTNGEATTDRAGRFRIEGLVPGLKYLINVRDGSDILVDYTSEVSSLESGKVKDLGDRKGKPAPGKGKE